MIKRSELLLGIVLAAFIGFMAYWWGVEYADAMTPRKPAPSIGLRVIQ